MLLGDYVALFCGPPVFGALSRLNCTFLDRPDLWARVSPRFLDRYDPNLIGRLDVCRYCWSNRNQEFVFIPHSPAGGGVRNWASEEPDA